MKKYLLFIAIQAFSLQSIAFEAHEWGTFTSLVGSNGETQTGMYHEDEVLPDFVHGFGETRPVVFEPFPNDPDGCSLNFKTCFAPVVLENNFVSQKMETPVIYFYGDRHESVRVDVEFPDGIITETFPAPVTSSPKYSDDLEIANGKASFEVTLLPQTDLLPPEADAENIYSHARNVDSLMISSGFEVEKFIFYRGLGRFTPQFHIGSEGSSLNMIYHESNKPEAAFLVYTQEGEQSRMMPLIGHGGQASTDLGAGMHQLHISEEKLSEFKNGNLQKLFFGELSHKVLVDALDEAGLHTDEAQAMVNTWKNGYFKTPGLRLLYILPKAEVDQVLPLSFTPAPEKIERVFVARIELMLEQEELDIVAQIIKHKKNFKIESLGRLAEPKLRRASEVYRQQHMMFQSVIEGFEYGLFDVFDELVKRSFLQESSPLLN